MNQGGNLRSTADNVGSLRLTDSRHICAEPIANVGPNDSLIDLGNKIPRESRRDVVGVKVGSDALYVILLLRSGLAPPLIDGFWVRSYHDEPIDLTLTALYCYVSGSDSFKYGSP